MLLASVQAKAGWDIAYCNELDSLQKCSGHPTVFEWNGDKVSIYAMVTNDSGLSTSKLFFKIFDMKNDHTGDIYAELRTATRPDWVFTTKKMYFVKPGYYKVEVYDEGNKRLAESFLTITERL